MTVVRAPSNSRVIGRFAVRGDFHELLDEAVVLMGAAVANWRNGDTLPWTFHLARVPQPDRRIGIIAQQTKTGEGRVHVSAPGAYGEVTHSGARLPCSDAGSSRTARRKHAARYGARSRRHRIELRETGPRGAPVSPDGVYCVSTDRVAEVIGIDPGSASRRLVFQRKAGEGCPDE